MTKDYRITLKIQNNYLWRLMQERGLRTAAELSRAAGVSPTGVGRVLNLQTPAYGKNGEIYAKVQKLCDFFVCGVEDLFPEQHVQESLPLNKKIIEVNMEQLIPSHLLQGTVDPASVALSSENAFRLQDKMTKFLTDRERTVLALHWGLEGEPSHTFAEIAEELSLTPTRIQQIEAKAMRKIRQGFVRDGDKVAPYAGRPPRMREVVTPEPLYKATKTRNKLVPMDDLVEMLSAFQRLQDATKDGMHQYTTEQLEIDCKLVEKLMSYSKPLEKEGEPHAKS